MSVVEQIFWTHARGDKLGFSIRRQHPIAGITLDFYCHEAALAIEFDWEQHDPAYDQTRDAKLLELGIETIRISNREFFMLDKVDGPRPDWLEQIICRCEARSGRNVQR
jgi:very-short-patch-repair endonuclease